MLRWEYLASGLIACAGVAALDALLGTGLLRRRRFWAFLGAMLVFQAAFETYATARPFFEYDPCCIAGPRLVRTPIEDFFFGLALYGLVVVCWEWAGRRWDGR